MPGALTVPARPSRITRSRYSPCAASTAAIATARDSAIAPPTYFNSFPFPATQTTPPGATPMVKPFSSIASSSRPMPSRVDGPRASVARHARLSPATPATRAPGLCPGSSLPRRHPDPRPISSPASLRHSPSRHPLRSGPFTGVFDCRLFYTCSTGLFAVGLRRFSPRVLACDSAPMRPSSRGFIRHAAAYKRSRQDSANSLRSQAPFAHLFRFPGRLPPDGQTPIRTRKARPQSSNTGERP